MAGLGCVAVCGQLPLLKGDQQNIIIIIYDSQLEFICRAKHCRVCNRCVDLFDHHCPFIYSCVGRRNRIWFFLFVLSVAINCSYTIYFALYCVWIEGFTILYLLGLLEAIAFCGLGWILTCTSVYRIYKALIFIYIYLKFIRRTVFRRLISIFQILHACMNLTTNEMFNYKRYGYLRDKRGRYQNPFSRGPFLNLIEFFICSPDRYDDENDYVILGDHHL